MDISFGPYLNLWASDYNFQTDFLETDHSRKLQPVAKKRRSII